VKLTEEYICNIANSLKRNKEKEENAMKHTLRIALLESSRNPAEGAS